MSDYTDLMNKVKTEQCTTYEEANDVLMTKLRIMCEIRQIEHVHGKETDVSVSHLSTRGGVISFTEHYQ